MLFFDFRYEGERCREQTALSDTPANRKSMQKLLDQMAGSMKNGSFEYSRFFPNSAYLQKHPEWTLRAKPDPFKAPAMLLTIEGQAHRDEAMAAQATLIVATPHFSTFADLWVAENEPRWRLSTRESVVGTLKKHLLPAFGPRSVGEITKSEILLFRAGLAKLKGRNGNGHLSGKTVNHVIGLLKSILEEASGRHAFTNPAASVGRLRQQKRDIEPLSLEQVKAFLAVVRDDYRSYFTVRFFTGMRTGEIDGLKWKFVDFDRRQILVRETWTKGRLEYTKTDGSQREIEMSTPVFEALTAQARITKGRSEYVFCDTLGGPLAVQNVTDRVWAPTLRLLGLAHRRMYQTRHTCATLWLAANENPEWIARQLGHVNTEMLFKTYSRFVPNLTRRDGSAFERLVVDAMTATLAPGEMGRTEPANDELGETALTLPNRKRAGGRHG